LITPFNIYTLLRHYDIDIRRHCHWFSLSFRWRLIRHYAIAATPPRRHYATPLRHADNATLSPRRDYARELQPPPTPSLRHGHITHIDYAFHF
jgi:hypothetical protein